jgi:hypothetical protein
MIIFDEYVYAENLLDDGFSKHMSLRDLVILARYYHNQGLRGMKLREALINFCLLYNPEYNDVIYSWKIDKAISSGKKREIRATRDIIVSQEELEIIWNAGNLHKQKILFCMLVVARFFKNEDKEDYYFNAKFTELLKIAKVNVDKAARIEMMNGLTKDGYISPTYTGAFKINFAGGENIGVIVKDIEEIVSFFPIRCSECKEICENVTRRHGMCEECYKIKRKLDSRAKQRKYDRKRATKVIESL